MTLARWTVWVSACAGIFIAFGWPFLVASDPADAALRILARVTTAVLLLALAAAAFLRARRAARS